MMDTFQASFARFFRGGSGGSSCGVEQQLTIYLKELDEEIELTRASLSAQSKSRRDLEADSGAQQVQLYSWGLREVLPDFRRLAALRKERVILLENMATHALLVLKLRHDEVRWIQHSVGISSASPPGREEASSLRVITASVRTAYAPPSSFPPKNLPPPTFFCPPEQLLAKDMTLAMKRRQLAWMDAAISSASARVEDAMPQCFEPKAKKLRRQILLDLLDRYAALSRVRRRLLECIGDDSGKLEGHPPSPPFPAAAAAAATSTASLSSPQQGLLDTDAVVSLLTSGPEAARGVLRRRKIERTFAEVVSDERTREGRLLKRWCDMATRYDAGGDMGKQKNGSSGESRGSSGGGGSSGSGDSLSGSTASTAMAGTGSNHESALPMPIYEAAHPRSVMAFINYFAESVLGEALGVFFVDSCPNAIAISDGSSNDLRSSALGALVQSLVFRRVARTIYRGVEEQLDSGAGVGSGLDNAAAVNAATPSSTPLSPSTLRAVDAVVGPTDPDTISLKTTAEPRHPRPPIHLLLAKQRQQRVGPSLCRRLNGYWRRQCRRLRRVSPQELGVPPEFIPPHVQTKDATCHDERTGNDRPAFSLDAARATTTATASDATSLREALNFFRGTKASYRTPGPAFGSCREFDCYWRTSRLLSKIAVCVVPSEMLFYFMAAMRVLHYEAAQAASAHAAGTLAPPLPSSGDSSANLTRSTPTVRSLDADSMFPIVTLALVHADLPLMHTYLFLLRQFAVADHPSGEAAYFLTNFEAAASFVMDYSSSEDNEEQDDDSNSFDDDDDDDDDDDSGFEFDGEGDSDGDDNNSRGHIATRLSSDGDLLQGHVFGNDKQQQQQQEQQRIDSSEREGEDRAMRQLGTWLGAQEAMEDTIDVLVEEGWF